MDLNEIFNNYVPQLSPEQTLAMAQFDVEKHGVFDKMIRKDKLVKKKSSLKDKDNKPIMVDTWEPVNRIGLSYQEQIVAIRTAFMNAHNATLTTETDDSELLAEIKRVRNKNKYAYKINQIANLVMSELQCAELWYLVDGKPKVHILSPSRGDLLKPVYDDFGDLIAVVRLFVRNDVNVTEIYDNDIIATWYDGVRQEDRSNFIGKIPIVLYEQKRPEWFNVQSLIERREILLSNFGDTNQYNGAPIIVAKGKIEGLSDKGDQGKVFQLGAEADMKYLTWDSAPDSIALESKTLEDLIYKLSSTPDISLDALKGLGLSGDALTRVMISGQLAAENKLFSGFGESMQRSVNLLKHILVTNDGFADEEVEIELEAFKFNDIDMLSKMLVASSGTTMSQESAVKMLATALGLDPKEEWERFQAENDLLIES